MSQTDAVDAETVYSFQWDHLGDPATGRPHLGNQTSVTVYRLMQYTFRDIMDREFGPEKTRELFIRAGHLAGTEFCTHVLDTHLPLNAFLAHLADTLVEMKVGILRLEQSNPEALEFTLTVSEDLDCSGLPILGHTVCDYDEGFIAGIFEAYTGRTFSAREIDCWAVGDRTCRFKVSPLPV